jgi:hypothetical protein
MFGVAPHWIPAFAGMTISRDVNVSRNGLCFDFKATLKKSVRVEPVETQAIRIKGFDKLSPNGRYLLSVS